MIHHIKQWTIKTTPVAPHRAHDDVEAVQRHTLRRDGDTSKTSVLCVCVA